MSLYAVVGAPARLNAVPEDSQKLKHHLKDGKGFQNPWESYTAFRPLEFFSDLLWRRFVTRDYHDPDTTPPTVPVRKPNFLTSRETRNLRATWLGHACYYVEFPGGFRALFDPVFTPRCSPVSFMGPKRYTDAPCQVKDIPFIDACIISHAHYDHLSVDTVKEIKAKNPNTHFFAPLGNKSWFTATGIENMTELDWWEEREISLSQRTSENTVKPIAEEADRDGSSGKHSITATISCLPCQHSANRSLTDKDQTLWSSWSVHSGGKSLYFGGDTGYRGLPKNIPKDNHKAYAPDLHRDHPHCPAFQEIGNLRGPFDLGLIPIGAYQPRYIMSSHHADPFDSVDIFKDTKCKRAMGIHWGTWVLTEEDVLEPPQMLKEALRFNAMPEEGVFDVCDIGESREFE